MADIAKVLEEVNAVNAVLPGVVQLIVSLRTPKGESVLSDLDAAEAQNAINEAEAQAFIDEKKTD